MVAKLVAKITVSYINYFRNMICKRADRGKMEDELLTWCNPPATWYSENQKARGHVTPLIVALEGGWLRLAVVRMLLALKLVTNHSFERWPC
jgi:hypothetical protein